MKRSTASSSLFGHWDTESTTAGDPARAMKQLTNYIEFINLPMLNAANENVDLAKLCIRPDFALLEPFFESVFCLPASSAPVERIFSQSGLIMRPNRARMSDTLLESLVFLRCNKALL